MPNTVIKWHGGKAYLASKIVALMRPHEHYVEPFAGGLSVLLAKDPEGVSEVANDVDLELTGFWRCLSDPASYEQFKRLVEAVPFSEYEWKASVGEDTHFLGGRVTGAVRFFIRCRQSLAGRMAAFAPITKTRTRRGMNEQVSAWLTAIEGLPAVHARLRRVAILCRDACDVIREFDNPKTVIYCDPPYLKTTRAAPDVYRHEMTGADHGRLLDTLGGLKHAKFLLSGYPSRLYDAAAGIYRWHCIAFDLPNNAASGDEKRRMTECVWCNFTPGATG